MQTTVPNKIFDYHLAPNALKVYVYLLSRAEYRGEVIAKIATIQERCAIAAEQTVATALRQLASAGLIFVRNRRSRAGCKIANAYTVVRPAGNWFSVDTDTALPLDKSAFVVYLYYLRCANVGFAFPSLRELSAALQLSIHTVIRARRALRALLLLIVAKWRSTMRRIAFWVQKKKSSPAFDRTASFSSTIYKIPSFFARVKSFFRNGILQVLGFSIKTKLLFYSTREKLRSSSFRLRL